MRSVRPPVLGELELLVALAVLKLGGDAYSLAISDEIEATAHRTVSRPAVLITLQRLEDKGLLTSWYGDPTPVRGGKAKRIFAARPLGVAAVKLALERIEAMARGAAPILEAK
jgi:DNA-binding PadR family transcriptional regulator